MSGYNRRQFLTMSTSALALASCGINSPTGEQSSLAQASDTLCDARTPSGPLRIDMHCHFLNLRDLSAGPFVVRRALNYDESNLPGLDAAAGLVVGSFARLLRLTTKVTSKETGNLRYEMKTKKNQPYYRDPVRFCKDAAHYQDGFLSANGRRQLTGIFSNKVRNAGRIAEVFPSIDIFMPSMVDLYDDRRSMQSVAQQIHFYEALNLSTGGRYLPMVSYNPQRQYQAELRGYSGEPQPYLELVKEAVLKKGFVGVKLHPSSGFSPINNLRYGCVNTATQLVDEDDQELYDRFVAYDRMLEELYSFCSMHNVPILTHGSTGITSNRRCMRGWREEDENRIDRPAGRRGTGETEWRYLYRRIGRKGGKDSDMPLEWTNAPGVWDGIATKFDVKVIISHFSDSLEIDEKRSVVKPSPWLMEAVKICNRNPNVYLDLSIITEFFRQESVEVEETGKTRKVYRIRPGYRMVFAELNRQFPNLRKQLLYGTDWHMPHTAVVGADFLPLVERLLDESGLGAEKEAIMGTRAVELFGLKRGQDMRRRLEAFYAERGAEFTGRPFTPDDIDWMQKLG
jgi:predicted TIM-barrel fold metal-dependent hydrolase